jgi:N-acetylneuraminic acid mutarotase
MRPLLSALLILLLAAGLAVAAPLRWRAAAPVPQPRSEVAATLAGGEIFVVGGFTPEGQASSRVDAYSPRTNRWRRVTDLPLTVHHPMAAGYRGRLYVLGGYGPEGARPSAFELVGGVWAPLTGMPATRAAGGAAVVGGKIYVVGGVTTNAEGARSLARETLVYDIARRSWSRVPGPTMREHLGVAALNGRIYAVGGRLAGADTNLDLFEVYAPGARRWRRLPRIPGRRGGTAATGTGRLIVSAGGETPTQTIRAVFAYDTKTRRWRSLPNLPTPRHGLGVVAVGGRVFVVAGGRRPGLAGVSGANEVLALR